MGEVKDAVKGTPKKAGKTVPGGENLLNRTRDMMEEVSGLTAKKDDDAASEGDNMKAENLRKAGTLRAVHSLLSAAERLLSDY